MGPSVVQSWPEQIHKMGWNIIFCVCYAWSRNEFCIQGDLHRVCAPWYWWKLHRIRHSLCHCDSECRVRVTNAGGCGGGRNSKRENTYQWRSNDTDFHRTISMMQLFFNNSCLFIFQ